MWQHGKHHRGLWDICSSSGPRPVHLFIVAPLVRAKLQQTWWARVEAGAQWPIDGSRGRGRPWIRAVQSEHPLDVTFVGDRGVLDHVLSTSVGLCNPWIEKGRNGNNPDSARLVGGQGQTIPALCSSPAFLLPFRIIQPLLCLMYLL